MTAQDVADRLRSPPELERFAIAATAVEIVFAGLPERFDYVTRPDGLRIASGSNGFGDMWRIHFCDHAAAVRAFEHENTEHEWWSDMVAEFPSDVIAAFGDGLQSRHREGDWATFGAWRRADESTWTLASQSPNDNASRILYPLLDGTVDGLKTWTENAGMPVERDVIASFFTFEPLKRSELEAAGPFDLEAAEWDLDRLGYTLLDE